MMIQNKTKRIGIYFIYDKDGVIDLYILEQLIDLRKNVDFLHCVINGKLTPDGRNALSEIVDEIYVRENKGNDIGAYKAAIKHIGWEKISEYDELIISNFTCFGPVYPFREVFEWSEHQNVELWGLTYDHKSDWMGSDQYLHSNQSKVCIQSYFLAIRTPLLGSKLLIDFFDEIPEDVDYIQSGSYFEYAFPGYFEERGYKSAVYCDNLDDLNYPLLFDPVRLLREKRMPLFKKRSFFHHYTDVLNNSGGEATLRLIRFLENETDYDMDLVWSSVLRTSSLSDLVRFAQLNRVLPKDNLTGSTIEGTMRVGFVYHAYYEDLFDECVSYAMRFSDNADILITTDSEEKRDILEEKIQEAGLNAEITLIKNRGRDVSALLVGAADFVATHDLICFAHDKKSSQFKPDSIGRSWAYKIHDNLFGSKIYIENVIRLFEQEKRLGIAFPSGPNHGVYPYTLGTGWMGNFRNTQKLLQDFHIQSKIHEHTLCVAPLGTCFWFRTDALKKLFQGYNGKGWSYQDFPREPNRYDQTILHAIERAYAYFAQDAGYYPVYLYNDQYARVELTNLEFVKTGSADMRMWCEALVMSSISGKAVNPDRMSEESLMQYENINYGVKQSLRHLALALRIKYPRFWSVLLPIRRAGQKILKIKTK